MSLVHYFDDWAKGKEHDRRSPIMSLIEFYSTVKGACASPVDAEADRNAPLHSRLKKSCGLCNVSGGA